MMTKHTVEVEVVFHKTVQIQVECEDDEDPADLTASDREKAIDECGIYDHNWDLVDFCVLSVDNKSVM